MYLFIYRQRTPPNGSPFTATNPFFIHYLKERILFSHFDQQGSTAGESSHHNWVLLLPPFSAEKELQKQLFTVSATWLSAEFLNNPSYFTQPQNGELGGKIMRLAPCTESETELFPAKTPYLFSPFTEPLIRVPSSTFCNASGFYFQKGKAKLGS